MNHYGVYLLFAFACFTLDTSAEDPSGGSDSDNLPNIEASIKIYGVDEKLDELILSIDRASAAISEFKDVSPDEKKELLSLLEESVKAVTSSLEKIRPVLDRLPEALANSRVPVRDYMRDARHGFVEPIVEDARLKVDTWISLVYFLGVVLVCLLMLVVLVLAIAMQSSVGRIGHTIDNAAAVVGGVFSQYELVKSVSEGDVDAAPPQR